MRKKISCVLLAAGLIMVGAGMAQAAGFNIYEAGSRATAMGGAFTATADDGSAIFYNAAGLSFQENQGIDLNVMPVNPRFKFQGATTAAGEGAYEEATNQYFPIPGAYYTNSNGSTWAFGVGVYAPFGLGLAWENPEEFVGRQVSYDVGIETVYVTPAVSYKIVPELAFAIGLDIATQHLDLNKYSLHPELGVNALNTNINGRSEINITPSFGVMYRYEGLSLGLMYHHKKTMKFTDQDATLTNAIAAGDPGYSWSSSLLAGLGGSDQTISSELNLPYLLSLGVAYQFGPYFRAELDFVKAGWSTFQSLDMDFANDALDQEIHFNYTDTWQTRFGLDIALIQEKLSLMLGLVHDNTPQPLESVSPLLPDSDRNDYSIGLEFKTGNWKFTGAYMAVIGEERTNIEDGQPANPDPAYPVGTYKSVANIFGAGIGYRF